MEPDMDRRSFFRALGLGAASAAVASVLPRAAVADQKGTWDAAVWDVRPPQRWNATHTSAAGSHSHSVCNCHSAHNHGCMVHMTGIYAIPVGTLVLKQSSPGVAVLHIKRPQGWVVWDGSLSA